MFRQSILTWIISLEKPSTIAYNLNWILCVFLSFYPFFPGAVKSLLNKMTNGNGNANRASSDYPGHQRSDRCCCHSFATWNRWLAVVVFILVSIKDDQHHQKCSIWCQNWYKPGADDNNRTPERYMVHFMWVNDGRCRLLQMNSVNACAWVVDCCLICDPLWNLNDDLSSKEIEKFQGCD